MATLGQYFIFPLVWILSKLFLGDVVFKGEEHLDSMAHKPVIIIANHISSYDSFLLRLSRYWKHLHVYFMGVTKFESKKLQFLSDIGIIPLVYKLFGVFTVIPGLGLEKNLKIPKILLAKNNGVFIFPEGYINRSEELLPFKKGAAVLAIATGAQILPIGFRDMRRKGKTKVIITIGEPVSFPKGTNVGEATEKLQDIIFQILALR